MKILYCVAQNDVEVFNNYLIQGLQKMEAEHCAIASYTEGEPNSIFYKYNGCVKNFISQGLVENGDVFAFIHEDVKILDPNFQKKVELLFGKCDDVGMCGVVGTAELGDDCMWWSPRDGKLRGHIMQENKEKTYHLVKGNMGYFNDIVAVDGLCFFIRADLFLDRGLEFDEKSFNGYDFYDIDIGLQVLEKGMKIAVADILVQHKSTGNTQGRESWHKGKEALIKKWVGKGYKFPLSQLSFIKNEIESNVEEIRL